MNRVNQKEGGDGALCAKGLSGRRNMETSLEVTAVTQGKQATRRQ